MYASIYSEVLQNKHIREASDNDTTMIMAAMFLIFVMMVVYFTSLLLAVVTVLFIIFSIGAAAVITKGILQISYASNLNQINFITMIVIAANLAIAQYDIHKHTTYIKYFKGKIISRTSYFF